MWGRLAMGGAVLVVVAVLINISLIKEDDTTIESTNRNNPISMSMPASSFQVSVPAFPNGASIPVAFTCDGGDRSPQIEWSAVPEGTQSLVLIMEDRDVPREVRSDGLFVHWILYSIPAGERAIPEGGLVGSPGLNSAGEANYVGPCPPPQYEPSEHRYYFTLYALDRAPTFAVTPTKEAIMAAMEGHILGQAEYMGRYKRP